MKELIAIALAPVVIIATYIYYRDKYEKEPWHLLIKALLLGGVIVLPILVAEKIMSAIGIVFTGIFKSFWNAFFVAALCEEIFKYLAFILFFWKNKSFNEKYDGIIYAAFISLGFAAVENILYVTTGGFATGLARAITAVPAHALMGISMGYFFGIARFYTTKYKYYLRMAFLFPFIMHGIYDFILMSGHTFLLILFIPFVIFMWLFGFKKMKVMNETSYFRDDMNLNLDFSKITEYTTKNEEDQKH